MLLDIYHSVDALPGIKKSFIGSGVRYDLLQYQSKDPAVNRSTAEYTRELIAHHVSGRLKVAPEHTSDQVLQIMRKPSPIRTHPWRKRWDSNPRALADNLISSQARYDHFDTLPYRIFNLCNPVT